MTPHLLAPDSHRGARSARCRRRSRPRTRSLGIRVAMGIGSKLRQTSGADSACASRSCRRRVADEDVLLRCAQGPRRCALAFTPTPLCGCTAACTGRTLARNEQVPGRTGPHGAVTMALLVTDSRKKDGRPFRGWPHRIVVAREPSAADAEASGTHAVLVDYGHTLRPRVRPRACRARSNSPLHPTQVSGTLGRRDSAALPRALPQRMLCCGMLVTLRGCTEHEETHE
jgi:hypothetical protein